MALLRSRQTIVAVILAAIMTGALFAVSRNAAALVPGLPIVLVISWLGVWMWERRWERKHRPAASPFARRTSAGGMRTMLRQDRNAHFIRDARGFLWRRRIWFEATGCPPVEIARAQYRQLEQAQRDEPVMIASTGDRAYWWWQDAFYWENEGYSARDVMALVMRTRRQKERQLQHAHALLDGARPRRRESIPEDVRRFVWQRDGGRCQECGSAELLQYDHIIPWSLGGADTAENLRLLCAECNRLKSDTI